MVQAARSGKQWKQFLEEGGFTENFIRHAKQVRKKP